jgi:hypothetical protein
MKKDNPFQTIFSSTLHGDGSMELKFPIPPKDVPYVLSCEHVYLAIEYYLLARYAYLHKMHTSFMINSFWAIEHLILSILILAMQDKRTLKEIGGNHSITKYWEFAKTMLPDKAVSMKKFDAYIGKVMGFYSERYPKVVAKGKLTYTGKCPRVTKGDQNKAAVRFGKVAHLSLDELDHFVNFMLHDITVYRNDCSDNLAEYLDSQGNEELYRIKNKYSIIYPNKAYHGEQG